MGNFFGGLFLCDNSGSLAALENPITTLSVTSFNWLHIGQFVKKLGHKIKNLIFF
jgi:hypothetical protein